MNENFNKKFEELFGDLEEKLEDLFHYCMEKKYGEKKLDDIKDYGVFLEARVNDITFNFRETLTDEMFYMEDDIEYEITLDEEDEDWDVPPEARGEPWTTKEEIKEEENKDLDDL